MIYKNKTKRKFSCKLAFSFVSLIMPANLNNFEFLLYHATADKKKLLLKQSYIILTWFFYLSFLNTKRGGIKVSALPRKATKFTLTKAPMAHKNWSKEQFELKFYNLKYTHISKFHDFNYIGKLNNALHFSLLTKTFFPKFETNLFFLKNFAVYYYFYDKKFYSYF